MTYFDKLKVKLLLLIFLSASTLWAQERPNRAAIDETYSRLRDIVVPVLNSPALYEALKDGPLFQRQYMAYKKLSRLKLSFNSLGACQGLDPNPFTTELMAELEGQVVSDLCDESLETQGFPQNFMDFRNNLEAVFNYSQESEPLDPLRTKLSKELIEKYLQLKYLYRDGGPLPSATSMINGAQLELCQGQVNCPLTNIITQVVADLRNDFPRTYDKNLVIEELNSVTIAHLRERRLEARARVRSTRVINSSGEENQEFSLLGHQAYQGYLTEFRRTVREGHASLLVASEELSKDFPIETISDLAKNDHILERGSGGTATISNGTDAFGTLTEKKFSSALEGTANSVITRIKELQRSSSERFYEELLLYHPLTLVEMIDRGELNNFHAICEALRQMPDREKAREASERLYIALGIGAGVIGTVGGFMIGGPLGAAGGAMVLTGIVGAGASIGVGIHHLNLQKAHHRGEATGYLTASQELDPGRVYSAWSELSNARNGLVLDVALFPLEFLGVSALRNVDSIARMRNPKASVGLLATAGDEVNLLSDSFTRLDEVFASRGINRMEDLSSVSDEAFQRFFGKLGHFSPAQVEQIFENLKSLHTYDLKGFFWYLDYYKNHDENLQNALNYFSLPQNGLDSLATTSSWWDRARLSYYEHMTATYNHPGKTSRILRSSPVKEHSVHYAPYPGQVGPTLMGDFSAALSNSRGHTYMIVGDAQGHGQQAARLSSYVTELLHTDPQLKNLVDRGADVDEITNLINRRLVDLNLKNNTDEFAAFSIARLENLSDGKVRARILAVEGNPIVVRPSGEGSTATLIQTDESIYKMGVPGENQFLDPTAPYENLKLSPQEVTLNRGDRLILDTDGIGENPVGNLREAPGDFDAQTGQYVTTGPSRYEELIESRRHGSAQELRDQILGTLGTATDDQYLWVLGF